MTTFRMLIIALAGYASFCHRGTSQEYGVADRGAPGDIMIQSYLAGKAEDIHATFTEDVQSLEDWTGKLPSYREQYLEMLGLSPLPPKTPLHPTITSSIAGEGYDVDMIHFQSRPGLYVTGNLYRPSRKESGERLPAVLYVCGHSYQGRAGNKTAYQSHGIWFARHGYICLVVDSLQLGEIAAIHHGTYRENRWAWISRGYTPAGVECWNGIRAIDYLSGRSDVDPERIAVTGISGGGAATFWIAAADERVRVAVPVSGMADLPSYVGNRVINGHCDCMFLHNTYQWPWTRIASLIAPRPLLFVNSDHDSIFPMDANERVINRLERLYSLYGRSDFVDAMVSIGGHAYRQDIRQAAYRFINLHLKNDGRVVEDSEEDLVSGERDDKRYPIAIDRLRVFPSEGDIPSDELNTTIDDHFVPAAAVEVPAPGRFGPWRDSRIQQLRTVSFAALPQPIPPARPNPESQSGHELELHLETEPGIVIPLRNLSSTSVQKERLKRVVLGVAGEKGGDEVRELLRRYAQVGNRLYLCEPRGVGATRWTINNPPNYVRRSHLLLGQTEDTGRVRDVAAITRYLWDKFEGNIPILVVGEGSSALWAAYAALWEPSIHSLILKNPPTTHLDHDVPTFLNILRVGDVADLIGLLAPRPLVIESQHRDPWTNLQNIYAAAAAQEHLKITSTR